MSYSQTQSVCLLLILLNCPASPNIFTLCMTIVCPISQLCCRDNISPHFPPDICYKISPSALSLRHDKMQYKHVASSHIRSSFFFPAERKSTSYDNTQIPLLTVEVTCMTDTRGFVSNGERWSSICPSFSITVSNSLDQPRNISLHWRLNSSVRVPRNEKC